MTWAEWAEAFAIFAKYAPACSKYNDVSAEHDEIWAGPDADEVSAEDVERLNELGWYEHEFGSFHRFV